MPRVKQYSERQQAILAYVRDFFGQHGYGPAYRDIQQALCITSLSTVSYHVKELIEQGLLTLAPGRARTLLPAEPLPLHSSSEVPLVGTLRAGHDLPDPETSRVRDTVVVPASLARADQLTDVYAVRVRGHALMDALLADGDVVLLRPQATVEDGALLAVRLDEDTSVTLTRVRREDDMLWLEPANPTRDGQMVPASAVRVEARVVGVLRGDL